MAWRESRLSLSCPWSIRLSKGIRVKRAVLFGDVTAWRVRVSMSCFAELANMRVVAVPARSAPDPFEAQKTHE